MSDPTTTPENEPESIKALREAAEAGKAARQELEQAKRQLMFAKAGIDTDTKLGKMLFQTFDGDDVEALKAEATEIGLLGGGNTTPAPDAADLALQQARDGLRGGAPSGGAPPETPHPLDDALKNFHTDRRERNVRLEEAQYAAIDRMIVAAANGDKRVVFDQDSWDKSAQMASRRG